MPITLKEPPIIVIGNERSGTTLVMAILGWHDRIAVPEVAWYYPRFRPYLFSYGDLSDKNNFRTLCHEMAYGLKTPFWDMKINPSIFGNEILEMALAREQSFAGAYCAMLDRYAEEMKKPRWGEKTPYNLYYIGEILEDFPNAKFVFITRDGRDASADYLESSFGPNNIYCASKLWRRGQKAVEPWREKLSNSQWLDIKYEDFVCDSENQVKRLCEFLGEDYSKNLLEFYQSDIAQRRGKTKDHAPLGHAISDEYIGIYKNLLSVRDQRIFSWVAGDVLSEMGYEDILEPMELSADQVAYYDEMDGRLRAVALEGPDGHLVIDSYNHWLVDQRNARRQAGLWGEIPKPVPFPIGDEQEEILAGLRCQRKWMDHLGIKRQYYTSEVVL